jgi:hypothetical protein
MNLWPRKITGFEKHRKSQARLFDMAMPKTTLAARLDRFTDDEASLKSTLKHQ